MEYFVSYYDYYQPEAYVPSSDPYIEKDSSINEDIDKMRHSATRSLLTRSDVMIVASVSCIYGLGSPEAYQDLLLSLETGQEIPREPSWANWFRCSTNATTSIFIGAPSGSGATWWRSFRPTRRSEALRI